jgi:hypothetical protein
MLYSLRTTFLKKDTEPCATSTTPCPICHETIIGSTALRGLHTRIRHTKTAARMLLSSWRRRRSGNNSNNNNALLQPRNKPSRGNYMTRIKRCGHCFCYDCLETWVQKQNTCPMCRDRLFCETRRDRCINGSSIQGDMELLLALREYREIREVRDASGPSVSSTVGHENGYRSQVDLWEDGHENRIIRGGEMV